MTEAVGLRRSSGVGCTADVRTPSGPNPSVSPLFRQSEAMKLDARHPEKKQKGVPQKTPPDNKRAKARSSAEVTRSQSVELVKQDSGGGGVPARKEWSRG